MSSTVNLPAVYIANIMGALLLLILVLGNSWHLQSETRESRVLRVLISFSLVSCLIDPICFACDGQPGAILFVLNYGSNLWLFLMNMVIGPLWLMFLSEHLSAPISRTHWIVIAALDALGFAVLLINFFVPLAFSVDAGNIYHRGSFYLFYVVLNLAFLADGLVLYYRVRRRSGMLNYFPIWAFMVPVFIGMGIQFLFYGVSTNWSFVAIGLGGVMMSLQNELIFRDKLTGLYNRFYLDNLQKKLVDERTASVVAMMLDLNGFKAINDSYGHAQGDRALVHAAEIMRKAVGDIGLVMRYAGDEFVVILNTTDESAAEECTARIRASFEEFNARKMAPYELSAAIGFCKLNMATQTVDELLNEIDAPMYDDKRNFYAVNPENDRRKRD